jgi:hypothetical protein
MLKKLFKQKFDADEYRALLWKRPDEISVLIKKSDEGYFAKLVNFSNDNIITEAGTGQKLVEMVNEAMYDYLNIPEVYRQEMGYFVPPENVRLEMSIDIPNKFLNKTLLMQKA